MSRSAFSCHTCKTVVGEFKPSKVFHPDGEKARLVFVDNDAHTATFRCVNCGATIVFRGGRIDLSEEQKTA